ncbi:MAG TPA: MurR/RpiR family transcriptional regulator [Pseudonocardia sp.]|nr:MurR/RpiR family transcriptional regulator [Pseudonocardia sp.]
MFEPGAVLVRIRGALPGLQPAEQRVAATVLDDPAAAAGLSVQALAARASTSTATVLRFCRAVGAEGYPQLRLALAGAAAAEAALDPQQPAGDIDAADSLDQVIAKIVHNEARALAETGAQLDRVALRTAVDAIAGARRIDVVGIGASGLVALDLQQKLHRIGLMAFGWTDAHAALTAAALTGPSDVLVAISHSGTTIDVLEPVALAAARGATTVGLTNFGGSPLATAAGVVLTTAARELPLRSAATASRIAQLAVVDCLFVGVAQRSYEAAGALLRGTYDAVQGRRAKAR